MPKAGEGDLVLIFSDRDGTINADKHYYLGSANDWRKQLEILPTVAEGIKRLNQIPNSKFIILTGQSGIALGGEEFKNLTMDRLEEVNSTIVAELRERGAVVGAYFSCGYVTSAYAEKAKAKGGIVLADWVNDLAECIKPRTGMMQEAAKKFNTTLAAVKRKFMIGDTMSDIQMGMNGGCELSILVPSFQTQELDDLEKIRALSKDGKTVLIVGDFRGAAEAIAQRIG